MLNGKKDHILKAFALNVLASGSSSANAKTPLAKQSKSVDKKNYFPPFFFGARPALRRSSSDSSFFFGTFFLTIGAFSGTALESASAWAFFAATFA